VVQVELSVRCVCVCRISTLELNDRRSRYLASWSILTLSGSYSKGKVIGGLGLGLGYSKGKVIGGLGLGLGRDARYEMSSSLYQSDWCDFVRAFLV